MELFFSSFTSNRSQDGEVDVAGMKVELSSKVERDGYRQADVEEGNP